MIGHYRFLRTKGGRCYFADVCVDIQLGGETMEAVDALGEHVDPDHGEVNRQTAPTWVAAALEGIQAAVAHAQHARGRIDQWVPRGVTENRGFCHRYQ